jgi:hypothetical protein
LKISEFGRLNDLHRFDELSLRYFSASKANCESDSHVIIFGIIIGFRFYEWHGARIDDMKARYGQKFGKVIS